MGLEPEEVYLISEAIWDSDDVLKVVRKLLKQNDEYCSALIRKLKEPRDIYFHQGKLAITGGLLDFFEQAKLIEKETEE